MSTTGLKIMKTHSKPVRVAIYTRVSDERTGQDTQNQRAQLVDHISHMGWTLVREYSDHERGWNPNRSQLKQLLADVSRVPRTIDLVLFWSLDRLSREGTLRTLEYLQHFDRAGVAWKSLTEQYLDSSGMFRDVIISMLAVLAKQETARMSERVKAGLARVKAEGRTLGPPVLTVDGEALRVMVADGWSMGRIGKALGVSKATVCRRMRDMQLAPAGEFTLGKGLPK
jgi:DNA invertase Pin-like site-specific DNA recombinase